MAEAEPAMTVTPSARAPLGPKHLSKELNPVGQGPEDRLVWDLDILQQS